MLAKGSCYFYALGENEAVYPLWLIWDLLSNASRMARQVGSMPWSILRTTWCSVMASPQCPGVLWITICCPECVWPDAQSSLRLKTFGQQEWSWWGALCQHFHGRCCYTPPTAGKMMLAELCYKTRGVNPHLSKKKSPKAALSWFLLGMETWLFIKFIQFLFLHWLQG